MEVKIQPISTASKEEAEVETSWFLRMIRTMIITFLKWTGLVPFSFCFETKTIGFKMISWKTLFYFMRLIVFTFPFIILPFIFSVFGFVEEGALLASKNSTSDSFVSSVPSAIVTNIGTYANLLVYVLPFIFAHFLVKPIENIYRIQSAQHNLTLDLGKSGAIAAVIPLLCFALFFLGKAVQVTSYLSYWYNTEDFSKYPFFFYTFLCKKLFIDFPLGFLLATHEYFLYQIILTYKVFAARILQTEEANLLLARTRELTVFMENFQNGYGFFLLVDLTLMLLYWLLHTFKAYFTFQASVIRKSENRMPSCSGALTIPCPLC